MDGSQAVVFLSDLNGIKCDPKTDYIVRARRNYIPSTTGQMVHTVRVNDQRYKTRQTPALDAMGLSAGWEEWAR